MPEKILETSASNVPSKTTTNAVPAGIGLVINACAGALIIAFFVPWIDFLGSKPSGFDIQRLVGGVTVLFWLIPIFAGLTLFAGFSKTSPKSAAQVAGAAPFFALIYGLYHFGGEILQDLNFGGFLGLTAGLVMFIAARRLK